MVTMDGYNTWLNPTSYESFRYRNDPATRSRIPPKDLSLVRLLMQFDGHFLRQGVKFMTTTHYKTFNHMMTPEMVDWFSGYSHEVSRLSLNEFRNMILYKNITDWTPYMYREWEIERLYMETQGNYTAFHDTYFKYMNMWQGSQN